MRKFETSFHSRRDFLSHLIKSGIVLGCVGSVNCNIFSTTKSSSFRRFHLSLSSQAWDEIPELPSIVRAAGITDVWLAAFLYGRWYRSPEQLKRQAHYLESKGLNVHIINVPLGHPGDALGLEDGSVSTTPPKHWSNASTFDGKLFSGTSIHPPAVEENAQAMKALQKEKFDTVFLDDDFRVAKFPGHIGGCFCDNCRDEFLEIHGYRFSEWEMLIDSVIKRHPSKVLRTWTNFWCAKLYDMFSALQNAAPEIELGIMVMYLGAEKAGIPLDRFRNVPFRVGELMFNDKEFGKVKGKTDELFSALFHRRFAQPELAYSETTAFPADALSAENMAAKLAVSLIADVRNTMFMSGLKPFPITHWDTLGPAMRKSALFHEKLAGHRPRGPFKHFWGWGSRLVGKDKPFSLFLASGIPFEVVEDISEDGWIFLSNEDAQAAAEEGVAEKSQNLIVRREAGVKGKNFLLMDENLNDIFTLKKRIIPRLKGIPFVEGDSPVAFAWYPSARKALLWNVEEKKQTFKIVRDNQMLRTVAVDALDVALIQDL